MKNSSIPEGIYRKFLYSKNVIKNKSYILYNSVNYCDRISKKAKGDGVCRIVLKKEKVS